MSQVWLVAVQSLHAEPSIPQVASSWKPDGQQMSPKPKSTQQPSTHGEPPQSGPELPPPPPVPPPAPPPVPPLHAPLLHVAPLLQLVHVAPPVPHCESFVAVTHVVPEQQPFGQVVASHVPPTHAPEEQV
jgi:hypothetical protein